VVLEVEIGGTGPFDGRRGRIRGLRVGDGGGDHGQRDGGGKGKRDSGRAATGHGFSSVRHYGAVVGWLTGRRAIQGPPGFVTVRQHDRHDNFPGLCRCTSRTPNASSICSYPAASCPCSSLCSSVPSSTTCSRTACWCWWWPRGFPRGW